MSAVRLVLVLALAGVFGVIACYGDPSYDGTSFKCDATHGCPPSFVC